MSELAGPIAFTIFAWWFSTGLILYLDGLPRHTFRWTMAGATLVCLAGFGGLAASVGHTSAASAYCAFTCALLVWAWQEVAFLLGIVTGPRRTPCPPDARGWRRARLAFETVLHHEAALLVLGAVMIAISWREPNATGVLTFLILWAMRQSAKLNVFLGVRNLSEGFLPDHLLYLRTYFARKPMNGLLPVSVALASACVVPLWQSAAAEGADGYTVASNTLLAALLTLAIVEHLFLVLPLPLEGLWKWGLRSRGREAPALGPSE